MIILWTYDMVKVFCMQNMSKKEENDDENKWFVFIESHNDHL